MSADALRVVVAGAGHAAFLAAREELDDAIVARFVGDPELLRLELAAERIDALIADLDGWPDDAVPSSLLAVARAASSELPVLLWLTPQPRTLSEIPGLTAGDHGVACVARGVDRLGSAVERALDGDRPRLMPGLLLPRLLAAAPRGLHLFLTACCLRPTWRLRVPTVLQWLGERPRTLRGHFQAEAAVSPHALRGYCLALAAAWLLDEGQLTPTAAAAALDCPDLTSLNRLLRAYAGGPAGALRDPGSFARLFERVENILRAAPSVARRYQAPRAEPAPVLPFDAAAPILARLAGGLARAVPRSARTRRRFGRALLISARDRDRLLAAGLTPRSLRDRLQYRPTIGGLALVPLEEEDADALFVAICRAREMSDLPGRRDLRTLAYRLRRVRGGLVPPYDAEPPAATPFPPDANPLTHRTMALTLSPSDLTLVLTHAASEHDWSDALRAPPHGGSAPIHLLIAHALELCDRLEAAAASRAVRRELSRIAGAIRSSLDAQLGGPIAVAAESRVPVSFGPAERELLRVALRHPRRLAVALRSGVAAGAYVMLDRCDLRVLIDELGDRTWSESDTQAERRLRAALIRRMEKLLRIFDDAY